MWDVYTRSHSNSIGLPQFWLEAFEAAYEHLVSDVPAVRDAAVLEIAKDVTGTALTHFTPTSSSTSITTGKLRSHSSLLTSALKGALFKDS